MSDTMNTLCACPSCGAALRVEAVAPPQTDRTEWRELRRVAAATGQPVARLRRLVREGALVAREGARGAWLVRRGDVEDLLAKLPLVQAGVPAGDEIERLRLVGGG